MERKQQFETQSVVLSKERFESLEEATSWIEEHDYKTSHGGKGADETATAWRFRQRDPGDFVDGSFRTLEVDDGVLLIRGRLKS
jgi:hypothetical protein